MSAIQPKIPNKSKDIKEKINDWENNELDNRAIAAAEDPREFESLLTDFRPFLWSRASHRAGSSYDNRDEMMSAAMQAFYEAVKTYNKNKGHFYKFMSTVVHMRLIDCYRKLTSYQVETVPLDEDYGDEGAFSHQVIAASLKIYEKNTQQRSLVEEIESFKQEIAEWGFSMDVLVENSPKQVKTRDVYKRIAKRAAADSDTLNTIFSKRYYPVKRISKLTKVPQKTVERARTFIVAALIIHRGDYNYLKNYVAAD